MKNKLLNNLCLYSFFETTFSFATGFTLLIGMLSRSREIASLLLGIFILGVHGLAYIGTLGLWRGRLWGYWLMLTLFALRVLKIRWPGISLEFQYGINFAFDLTLSLKQGGELVLSLNLVALILLCLLASLKGYFEKQGETGSVTAGARL